MTSLGRIEIYCDGGTALGYGHIRRATTLAAQLERDGLEVRLAGLSPAACALLPDPKTLQGPAGVVVFDAPTGLDERIAQAQARGQNVVALDWFGDAVVDVNVVIYPHQEVRARRHAYVGLDYVLVRGDIALAPQGNGGGRGVLVVLGGGDLQGTGHAVAGQLAALGLETTLVQGPLAADTRGGAGYRVLVNPPGLPELYASCRWAVTNGGGCMFEAMCKGKAVWALPQTDAESRVASFILEQGGVLGMGMKMDMTRLRDLADTELFPVAQRGAALVDGRGAQRISEIIRRLL